MINSEKQVNEIIEQMQSWILEQQLSNTENTLSNTIAFFSTTFAVIGIAVAILLVFAAWWMNKLFNSKLEKVRDFSEITVKNKNEVESIKNEISNKLDNIKHLEESLRNATEKLTLHEEIGDFLESENNYLKEKIEIMIILTRFQNIISKIEKSLLDVSDNNVIIKSKWANKYPDPLDEYEAMRSSYLEAKVVYDHFINKDYQFTEYLGDVDAGEQGDGLDELKSELENAQDFYGVLISILS